MLPYFPDFEVMLSRRLLWLWNSSIDKRLHAGEETDFFFVAVFKFLLYHSWFLLGTTFYRSWVLLWTVFLWYQENSRANILSASLWDLFSPGHFCAFKGKLWNYHRVNKAKEDPGIFEVCDTANCKVSFHKVHCTTCAFTVLCERAFTLTLWSISNLPLICQQHLAHWVCACAGLRVLSPPL